MWYNMFKTVFYIYNFIKPLIRIIHAYLYLLATNPNTPNVYYPPAKAMLYIAGRQILRIILIQIRGIRIVAR